MFGVGSLISPIMVYYVELDTFTVLGFVNVVAVFGYWRLKVPIIEKK